jgi:hypothetical protein
MKQFKQWGLESPLTLFKSNSNGDLYASTKEIYQRLISAFIGLL